MTGGDVKVSSEPGSVVLDIAQADPGFEYQGTVHIGQQAVPLSYTPTFFVFVFQGSILLCSPGWP